MFKCTHKEAFSSENITALPGIQTSKLSKFVLQSFKHNLQALKYCPKQDNVI